MRPQKRCTGGLGEIPPQGPGPNVAGGLLLEDSAFRGPGAVMSGALMHHVRHAWDKFDAFPVSGSVPGSHSRSALVSERTTSGSSSLLQSAANSAWSLSQHRERQRHVPVPKDKSPCSHTWQPSWMSCNGDSDTAAGTVLRSDQRTRYSGTGAQAVRTPPVATSSVATSGDQGSGIGSGFESCTDSMLSQIATEQISRCRRRHTEAESAAAVAARKWVVAEMQSTLSRGSNSSLSGTQSGYQLTESLHLDRTSTPPSSRTCPEGSHTVSPSGRPPFQPTSPHDRNAHQQVSSTPMVPNLVPQIPSPLSYQETQWRRGSATPGCSSSGISTSFGALIIAYGGDDVFDSSAPPEPGTPTITSSTHGQANPIGASVNNRHSHSFCRLSRTVSMESAGRGGAGFSHPAGKFDSSPSSRSQPQHQGRRRVTVNVPPSSRNSNGSRRDAMLPMTQLSCSTRAESTIASPSACTPRTHASNSVVSGEQPAAWITAPSAPSFEGVLSDSSCMEEEGEELLDDGDACMHAPSVASLSECSTHASSDSTTSLESRAESPQHAPHEKQSAQNPKQYAVLEPLQQRGPHAAECELPKGFSVFTNPAHLDDLSDSTNLDRLPQASVKETEVHAFNRDEGAAVYQNPAFSTKFETVGEESRALCPENTGVINRLYDSDVSTALCHGNTAAIKKLYDSSGSRALRHDNTAAIKPLHESNAGSRALCYDITVAINGVHGSSAGPHPVRHHNTAASKKLYDSSCSRALCHDTAVSISRVNERSTGSRVPHHDTAIAISRVNEINDGSRVSKVSRDLDEEYMEFRQQWSRMGKMIVEEAQGPTRRRRAVQSGAENESGALKRFHSACIRRCVKQPVHAFKRLAGCYKAPVAAQSFVEEA